MGQRDSETARAATIDLLQGSGTRTYPTQKQASYGRNSPALRVRSTARRNETCTQTFILLDSCKRSNSQLGTYEEIMVNTQQTEAFAPYLRGD